MISLKKLCDEQRTLGAQITSERNLKEFEKKFLTNRKRCVNIKQFAADARATAKSELPVPCKLNNVKTNYNTLDNLWIV